MKIKLLLIASLAILVGCRPIMIKLYGIKDPAVENEKTIRKKALKYSLDTSNIATINSSDFLPVFKGKSIPDCSIYDRNGKYIEYRQTDTSCNAGLFPFISALNLTAKYNQADSAGLKTELGKFRDLKGNALKPQENADFYILIYWAVWTGKLNKDHVKQWEDLARANKNCKIKVVKVNMDIQEYWNDQDREKIMKALHVKK